MLLQFAVTNYLSFRERTVLSALAVDHVNHDPKHILTTPNGTKVLRVLALYGANASGKSNLIKAMDFACRFIVDGVSPRASIPVVPFKLSAEHRDKPSTFEFEFIADNQHWSYGFSVTTERVESEWLYLVKDSEGELVFERTASDQEDTPPKIDFGPSITQDPNLANLVKFISQSLRMNLLLVYEIQGRYVYLLQPVIDWFGDRLYFQSLDLLKSPSSVLSIDEINKSSKGFVARLLQDAGTGIVNFIVKVNAEKIKINYNSASVVNFAKKISWKSRQVKNWSQIAKLPSDKEMRFSIKMPKKDVPLEILFLHNESDDVSFKMDEESDGTQYFFYLTPIVYELTQKQDNSSVFLIDELDRSLHPNLTRFILQTVLESEGTGQMIFTTHDTNLLDRTLLPEDSIWFVEKNDEGASSMYSLAEFQPEQLEQLGNSLERGYLQGRFGAIPFLGDPRRLGWIAKEQTEKATEDKRAEDKQ